ncbi:DUF2911 domain-containing protein [Pedobacter sp. ISL-68]|uniref:DUF2911 domain-containing protein n=1 Tax=unclassified Pedobacter TaxID=2628915 RepID=UPI001BE801E4|nr:MULTISPECIES: DUF2911 domain-containing protein [unclassified Pedobacter]MBT2563438.1 DUF2911 domain-containing protein [Pedobacter sp. ISL-64]MBT2592942.1 DUF2911 domain-containing protein [Pedobacter sp. ISL-68]
MKLSIKSVVLFLALLGAADFANAQGAKFPQPSSGQTIIQDFGLGKITLTYSRPNVKGRKIFGSMEPMGVVWRNGANAATRIKFTDAVKIEGKDLPAGEYGLFSIPGKNEWTVIFNKIADQWGAYEYKESDDVLRVKVKTTALKDKVETLNMQFSAVNETSAQLNMMWENSAYSINITTSIDEKVMANIAEAMKGEKKPYFNAAMYYYQNGKDLKTALEWMTEAEKSDMKAPWFKYWKGRIQLKMGDKAGATATAQQGIDAAKVQKVDEYVRLNSELLAEAKK